MAAASLADAPPNDRVRDDRKDSIRLFVDLRDGSRIKGTISIDSLPFETSFGKMRIPFDKFSAIRWSNDIQGATIHLTNGDQFRGSLLLTDISLQTILGEINLRVADMLGFRSYNSGQPIVEGLILWLDGRDFNGANWPDRSLQSEDVNIHHAEKIAENAVRFNGTDSVIMISRKHRPQHFTVCIWAKKEGPFSGFEESIISCNVDSDFYIDYGGAPTDNAEWRGVIFTEDGPFQANFTAGKFTTHWMMFAMSYDGTTWRLYQNGVQCNQTPAHGRPMMTGTHYQLGLRNPGRPHYKGYLGSVLIYERVLSDEEILHNFKAEASRFQD